MNGQIEDKENCVQVAQKQLNEFVNKFNENKVNYEIEIDTLKLNQKNEVDMLKTKLSVSELNPLVKFFFNFKILICRRRTSRM